MRLPEGAVNTAPATFDGGFGGSSPGAWVDFGQQEQPAPQPHAFTPASVPGAFGGAAGYQQPFHGELWEDMGAQN